MAKRITVVLSQGQSQNPAKRGLEEDIVAALLMEPGIDVTVIPHLYDLKPEGTGVLALQGISGDIIVLSWLYSRAAHWTLDRFGVRGREGTTLIVADSDEDEEDETNEENEQAGDKERVVDQRESANRTIYCIDLRVENTAAPYVEEVKRIAAETRTQVVGLTDWLGGSPQPAQLERFIQPTNNTGLGVPAHSQSDAAPSSNGNGKENGSNTNAPTRIEDEPGRRWYPVIDYSRCTNCMECIDFCLFGVYGVDKIDTILVEQPDNCRKGCPACSRVCPENAIIFPQHKTPAIAGAMETAGALKIDLSKLFGAPESEESAMEVAARERDEQLVLAGRDAVGMSVGIPKRQADKPNQPKDELDNLIDSLDELDL